MDIITFSTNLKKRMLERLQELETHQETPCPTATLAAKKMLVISDAIHELRKYVCAYAFQTVTEEITFFKEIKPSFVSQYIYHRQVYSICLTTPYMDKVEKQKYYNTILREMLNYTAKNHDFLKYITSGDTSHDEWYFTRPKKFSDPFKDHTFSTERDELLAVMLSHAIINDYLTEAAEQLNSEPPLQSNLTWTGKKTDLIELLFALHAVGCFNDAKADVKLIVNTFEKMLSVNLGNHYDYFQKMRARKRGQIVFLDQLRKHLSLKMDQLDNP